MVVVHVGRNHPQQVAQVALQVAEAQQEQMEAQAHRVQKQQAIQVKFQEYHNANTDKSEATKQRQ